MANETATNLVSPQSIGTEKCHKYRLPNSDH